MKDFVEQLFLELNKAGVDYAILRNYETLPNKPPETYYFDIDILVRSSHHCLYHSIVRSVARETKCQIVKLFNRQYVRHAHVVRFSAEEIQCVFLDAHIHGQSWWGFYYITEEEILKYRKKVGLFFVVDDFHRSLFNWLDKLLWGRYVKQSYRQDICNDLMENESRLIQFLEKIAMKKSAASEVIEIIKGGCLEKTLSMRRGLLVLIVIYAIKARPMFSICSGVAFFYYEAMLRLRPTGLFCVHQLRSDNLVDIVNAVRCCYSTPPLTKEVKDRGTFRKAVYYIHEVLPYVRKTGAVFLKVPCLMPNRERVLYFDDFPSALDCAKQILLVARKPRLLGVPNVWIRQRRP